MRSPFTSSQTASVSKTMRVTAKARSVSSAPYSGALGGFRQSQKQKRRNTAHSKRFARFYAFASSPFPPLRSALGRFLSSKNRRKARNRLLLPLFDLQLTQNRMPANIDTMPLVLQVAQRPL